MAGLNPLYSQIPDNPNLVELAAKILDRIHSNAVPILKNEILKRDIVLTEKLLNSLNRSIHIKHQEWAVECVLAMQETGQFADFNFVKYIGRPNFDSFLAASEKGFAKASFKNKAFFPPRSVPGYPGKDVGEVIARLGELKVLKRIVSATVIKMGQTATVRRPSEQKGWMKKYYTQIIFPMEDQLQLLAEAVAMKESERIIKQTIQQRNENGSR